MTPEDVSVVIPVLNETGNIETAIRSAWSNGAGQVIVCDGGSEDQSVMAAQQCGAVVVHSQPGRGRQLARGVQEADRAMLLFLHADNVLGPGCLEELCRCRNQAGDASPFWGGFRQQINAPSVLYRVLERANAARIRFRGLPFGDQAIFVSRAAYDQVGGFQPIPLMEDVVLSTALRQKSWPVLIDRTTEVDARRWQRRGLFHQTLRNWGIQVAHRCGVSEDRLAKWYR